MQPLDHVEVSVRSSTVDGIGGAPFGAIQMQPLDDVEVTVLAAQSMAALVHPFVLFASNHWTISRWPRRAASSIQMVCHRTGKR